jgi:tetratricopeptide (TPR) repeat protein
VGAKSDAALALLVALVLAAFAGEVTNRTSLLDEPVLAALRSFDWAEVRDAFDPRIPRERPDSGYAPLTDFSLAMDRLAYGGDLLHRHAQGLFLHLGAAMALFYLARRLGASDPGAVLAGAVFALHPVQVEAVGSLPARPAAVAGFLTLLAMLAWQEARLGGDRAAYGWSILWTILACLASPLALVTPLLLTAVEAGGRAPEAPAMSLRRALAYAPHVAIALAFAALAASSLAISDGKSRLVRPFASIGAHLAKIAWPTHLQPGYRIMNGAEGAGAIAAIALIVAAAFGMGRRLPLVAVGSLVAIGGLLPAAVRASDELGPRWDRDAYILLAGVGLLAAGALEALARRDRTLAVSVGAAIVISLGLATFARVRLWSDDLDLFRHAVAADPESADHQRHLGLALERRGVVDDAGRAYEAALAAAAGSGARVDEAGLGLAVFELRRGRPDAARAALERAIARDPERTPRCHALKARLEAGR